MGMSLAEVAEQLRRSDRKVQLIYAFNGTGKTRLSRELKKLIAPNYSGGGEEDGQLSSTLRKILYYSAFTEDLFYWDNDLDGESEPRLKIQPNNFTDWVLREEGQDQNIVSTFQRYVNDKLTPHFSEDFAEVTFSMERGDDVRTGNLKISKGEESNFIWSVFFAILEQVTGVLNVAEPADRETDQFNQLELVIIDDPVSSLDENHLIQLAVNLAQLIRSSESKDVKFIVSTHSPLFYNVFYNEVGAKNGYILARLDDGSFCLESKQGDSNMSFSYHLHIKKLIEQAVEARHVQRYHFALLRNLYEKTANFLGYRQWSDLLPGDKKAFATRIMNFYPHNTLSNEEISEPTPPEQEMIGLLLRNLNKFGYWQE